MIVTPSWYNLNSARRYPLDGAATGEDDSGQSLPHDILVDCNFQLPRSVGQYVFVSAVHSTESLVSLVFLASDGPISTACSSTTPSASTTTPIAVVNVPRASLVPNRQIPIEPLYPGVGGWVVLGKCRSKLPYLGRFSSPQQSLLLPRVAKWYDDFPIPDVGKLHYGTALTGLVLLRAGNDIEIAKETRHVGGADREVIAIRLANISGRVLLEEYAGPCGKRPESGNCLKPAIEAINTVTPDCNGNINIEFDTACLESAIAQTGQGIVLDYCLGLADACVKEDRLPKDGKLPNEYDDLCESSASSAVPPASSDDGGEQGSQSLPSAPEGDQSSCSEGPNENDFSVHADQFTTLHGQFTLGGGFYTSRDTSRRNVAIWNPCYYTTTAKVGDLFLYLRENEAVKHRGGLMFRFQYKQADVLAAKSVQENYYIAIVNKEEDAFDLWNWTGTAFVLLARSSPLGLKYDRQYHITVSVSDGPPSTATAQLYDVADSTMLAAFTASIDDPVPGKLYYWGLHANQSIVDFDKFVLTP